MYLTFTFTGFTSFTSQHNNFNVMYDADKDKIGYDVYHSPVLYISIFKFENTKLHETLNQLFNS